MKAIWNGEIIAQSGDTVVVEGNHYFPADSVNMKFLHPSKTRTSCPWKGKAHYFSVEAGGETNPDGAWYYPKTKQAANNIEGRVAFWKGIEVKD